MSLKWIAQRLHMGSWTYVSNLLNEPPQTHLEAQEVLPLCQFSATCSCRAAATRPPEPGRPEAS